MYMVYEFVGKEYIICGPEMRFRLRTGHVCKPGRRIGMGKGQ